MMKRSSKFVSIATALALVSSLPLSVEAADFTSPEGVETFDVFSDGAEIQLDDGADADAAFRVYSYTIDGIVYEHDENEDGYIVTGYDENMDKENIVINEEFNVLYLQSGCFANLSGIKTLTIPQNVDGFSRDIVDSWDGITIICPKGSYASFFAKKEGIPQDNTPFEDNSSNAMEQDGVLYQEIDDWSVGVVGYTADLKEKDKITIPEKINGKNVKKLMAGCFRGLQNIKYLEVESYNYGQISYSAFDSWDGITIQCKVFSPVWKFAKKYGISLEVAPYNAEYAYFSENHINYSFAEDGETLKAGAFSGEEDKYPIDLVVPSEIYGCPVTEIGVPKGRLQLYSIDDIAIPSGGIRNVYIPGSVKRVETGTFSNRMTFDHVEGFVNLKSVIFEDGDVPLELEEEQFEGCKSLSYVKLPSRLQVLPKQFFTDCPSLERLELPAGMTTIEEKALKGAMNLKQLHIPSTVTEIAEDALDGLKNVVIYGMEGSSAEDYASQHKLQFEKLEDKEEMPKEIVGRPVIDSESMKALEQRLAVSLKKKVEDADGYDFALGSDRYFAENQKFLQIKKNIKEPATSFNMKNLGAGTYYAAGRAWKNIGNKKIYGPWSVSKKVYVSEKALLMTKPPVIKIAKASGKKVTVNLSATSYPNGFFGVLCTSDEGVQTWNIRYRDWSTNKTLTFTNVDKGTYYVYARSFALKDGKKIYGDWSKVKKVVVK